MHIVCVFKAHRISLCDPHYSKTIKKTSVSHTSAQGGMFFHHEVYTYTPHEALKEYAYTWFGSKDK